MIARVEHLAIEVTWTPGGLDKLDICSTSQAIRDYRAALAN